jgi:prepilin-type N-terminal cleavage/methylation domain-containing protein
MTRARRFSSGPGAMRRGATAGIAGHRGRGGGFTLLEILLALALVGLMLVALNTFVFSMGELWGRNTDVRLFEQHARAVTRFLQEELRIAALPPAARAGATPITPQEIRPRMGSTDTMLTFELPAGCRLIAWPERPLPEVVCSLQLRDREGLWLLWHSRLETKFADDPPHETLITPFVTELEYDYYDADARRWTTETRLRRASGDEVEIPRRLRLKFTYKKLTHESVVNLPTPLEGLPDF